MIKRKACILTSGCPENRIDATCIEKFFETNGWTITDDYISADLILFNACGFTRDQVTKSLEIINKLQNEKKASSQLVVGGCLPKIDPTSLKKIYVGHTYSEREFSILNKLAKSDMSFGSIIANQLLPDYELKKPQSLLRLFASPLVEYYKYLESRVSITSQNMPKYFIKIASGCTGNCSYCGIRKSRGSIKSVPIDQIMLQFREGLKKGFRVFSLLGTDLGPYGIDLGYTLLDLLEEMISEKKDFKIGLRNVNPFFLRKMLDKFNQILTSNKLWYLGTAAESGSNRILKLMNRKYTADEFKKCLQEIHTLSPETMIRTQIMVGFPGETEQDFFESMNLIDELVFDFVEVYEFSKVPETPASIMSDQISKNISTVRCRKLILKYLFQRIRRKIKISQHARYLSRKYDVKTFS